MPNQVDLGVSMRMKYGFLLQNFTQTNTLPVFRTESQDRMHASAHNFALGFFGYPLDDQYQQSITIEDNGFNNTLAPYKTCPNARDRSKSDRGVEYVKQWSAIYLKDALERLRPQLHGYGLTIEDVYTLQQMCAYEVCTPSSFSLCMVLIAPRPSQLVIPSSASSLRRKNGKVSTMRMLGSSSFTRTIFSSRLV